MINDYSCSVNNYHCLVILLYILALIPRTLYESFLYFLFLSYVYVVEISKKCYKSYSVLHLSNLITFSLLLTSNSNKIWISQTID